MVLQAEEAASTAFAASFDGLEDTDLAQRVPSSEELLAAPLTVSTSYSSHACEGSPWLKVA